MFVADGAKGVLVQNRKDAFVDDYIVGLVREAEKLGITEKEIVQLISKVKRSDSE